MQPSPENAAAGRGETVWTPDLVVDTSGPALAMRCYLEFGDLRRMLALALAGRAVDAACDVGTGFGRLLPVLGEFAASVTGYEREPELVGIARTLVAAAEVVEVPFLHELPVPDDTFDLALSFTVLQHHSDVEAEAVLAEIDRVVRPGGVVVLCEETDADLRSGDVERSGDCTIGRDVSWYAQRLPRFSLVSSMPRRVEPTYPRRDTGTYIALACRARA